MTKHKTLRPKPPIAPALEASNFSPASKEALVNLDAALFYWHRMLIKGDLTGRLLASRNIDLEPALFQGLMAVVRITHGVARDGPTEPTVGLVAEEMNIDPSRASRICTGLIAKGYVTRAAAQDDGRKSVLLLSDTGEALFHEIWNGKWENLIRVFDDWSGEDIATFSRLFGRYVDALTDS